MCNVRFRKGIGGLLVFALMISLFWTSTVNAKLMTETALTEIGTRAQSAIAAQLSCEKGEILAQSEWFIAGDSISDWMAIAFKVSGIEESYDTYLKALETMVTESYATNGYLDRIKTTTYHRIALTVQMLGGDVRSFGKDASGNPVDLIAAGTYAYEGDVGAQGINGYIHALILLDSRNYEIPEGALHTREEFIDAILDSVLKDGSFGLSDASDVDITAMVIQALAPYYDTRKDCKKAIDKALVWLSKRQSDSGAMLYSGSGTPAENPESTCQMILALTALGRDPEQETDFIKGDNTLLTGLLQFDLFDGIFTHTFEDPAIDYMSTEQAMLAYASVKRLRVDGSRLYDPVTEVQKPESGETDATESASDEGQAGYQGIHPALLGAGTTLLLFLAGCLILRKRKNG